MPIIELFGSRAGGDWTQGFEYLGIFSADGLAMCDPELITWPVQPEPCFFAPRSVWRPLLTLQDNPGSLYRCGKRN